MARVEHWGWNTDTGHQLSFYKLDCNSETLDGLMLAYNSTILKLAAHSFGEYLDDLNLRDQFRNILKRVQQGGNWANELHNKAGDHKLIWPDGKTFDDGVLTITPASVVNFKEAGGVTSYAETGEFKDYQPGTWVNSLGTGYILRNDPPLYDGGSYFPGASLSAPMCIVMTTDGYAREITFEISGNALGLAVADVGLVTPTPWGKDFKPTFKASLIEVLGDDFGDGNGDDKDMRYYPRLSPGTIGAYRMEKEGVADIERDMWETDVLEALRQGIVGDASNAILGLHWFYGIRSIVSVGKQHQVRVGNVTFTDSAPFAIVKDEFVDFGFGSVTIPRFHGTYLDYTAVDYKMYLPFVGMIDLNPQDVVGQTIFLTYRINTTDGSAVCQVARDVGFPNSPTLIFNSTCQWGYDIPLRVDPGRSFGTVAVRTLTMGALMGDQPSYSAGSLTPNTSVLGDFEAKVMCYKRDDLTDGEGKLAGTGLPSGASMTVGEAKGYLQCSAVFNAATLPPRRTQEIIQLLRDGIYV